MDDASLNADKMRSYTTLNSMYHETRQEIDLLNKEMLTKDNIISELKARLGRFEGIYMAMGDKESVVLGPSKSLVESLCKEIYKLKQKRKDVELKASRQAEEIQKLTAQLRDKEQELDRVHCQPDHEKDQEIRRLRSALEERERSEATRAVLCTSLAEEADQLRGQLGTTVKVCQALLSRLEQQKKSADPDPDEAAAQEAPESCDVNELRAQVRQLQEENEQLKQRVAYVQGLNSQWQKYDSSREDYIRGLSQRLKETSRPPVGPGLSSVSAGLLQHEISRLNGLLDEKMSECERLSRDVDDVRRQDRERIQTLEQQVLIYADDFKSERADRERAQGQLEDLKDQVYQLKRQLHKQQGASRDSRDVVPVCRVHIGHRISSRRHKDTSEPLLRAAVEVPPAAAAAATTAGIAAATSPSAAWNNLSELQCPRCLTTFNEADAAEYLNHCEECAKL